MVSAGEAILSLILGVLIWAFVSLLETPSVIAVIVAIIFFVILIAIFDGLEKQKALRIAQQEVERKAYQEKIKAEKLQKEAKIREEAEEKIREKLRKRIKDFLIRNTGELFDELELRQQIEISTASEDAFFQSAIRTLPYNEGFRKTRREISYETYREYYYYVVPNE